MDPTPTVPPPARTQTDLSHFVTEDDTPVDNLPSEKQQRLLADPLYSTWGPADPNRKFLAAANVGLFWSDTQPPLVPDFLLSLDVQVADDWWTKRNRSYFMWVIGKRPDVVVEIVSNREGGETEDKHRLYAQIGIPNYVIFDPQQLLNREKLRVFGIIRGVYELVSPEWLPPLDLGLILWQGKFEGKEDLWLRWCDHNGTIIPTGAERAEQEEQRAEQEKQRAEQEKQRAEQEKQRADRLAAQLRALGVNPEV